MAVVKDAVGTELNQTTTSAGVSFNYTGLTVVSNTNGAIVVTIACGANTGESIQSITGYTKIAAVTAADNFVRSEVWGKVGNSTGLQTIVITPAAGWTTNDSCVVSAISVTGADQTGGVTTFNNSATNTGNSNNATINITTTASDLCLATAAVTTNQTAMTQTQMYFDSGPTPSSGAAYNQNSGSTPVTFATTGGTSASQWSMVGTNIKAVGASTNPFRQSDWSNPRSQSWDKGYIFYSEQLVNLPNPKPFSQNDWPPPRASPRPDAFYSRSLNPNLVTTPGFPFSQSEPKRYIHLRGPQPINQTWVQNLLLTTLAPTGQQPFKQFDWPNPQRISWYQNWIEVGNSQLPFPTPFLPQDQSLSPRGPQRLGDYFWSQGIQQAIPFNQLDWPNPKILYWYRDWNQNLVGFYQSETFPFVQSDYPNSQRINWNIFWSQSPAQPAPQTPFFQSDWPLPRTNVPIQQFWSNDLNLLPQPTPFFQNVDFPLPVVRQPIDQTWVQNLLNSTLFAQFPFRQSDWPVPKTYIPIDQFWYDNPELLLQFIQGNPFRQSDWPVPKGYPPIDQFWFINTNNLPIPPPPPPIQQTAGRWIFEPEVEEEIRLWRPKVVAYEDGTLSAELGRFRSEGGIARAKVLTPDQRAAIARQGATARWKK